MFYIAAEKVFTPVRVLENVAIGVKDGRIYDIRPKGNIRCSVYPILTPGYIDTHTHGISGKDITTATAEDLELMSLSYAKHGVTTFFPTTVSCDLTQLLSVIEVVKRVKASPGAKIGGIHIEGPYLSKEKKGAQEELFLRKPSVEEVEKILNYGANTVKIFSIAPELRNSFDVIKLLLNRNVVVSLAHSNATYEIAKSAIELGCSRCTHVFNAMRKFSHRDPGIVGAVLLDPGVACEIILDLVHIHAATAEIVYRLKGPRKTILISDSIAATDLEDGEYALGGATVDVRNSIARIKGSETLAGSTLTLDAAVRNAAERLDIDLERAIQMATLAPAMNTGLSAGVIELGRPADLVALDDDLKVLATWVDGGPIWKG